MQKMYFLKSYSHNPYFNLATEEYLLKHCNHFICFVYQNNHSVIVGKHQNTNREINHRFVHKHHISVARRITGGGAVYHDRGNLNISIIKARVKGEGIDFQGHTKIIRQVLSRFNVEAGLHQKSNLFTRSLKISGNAAHLSKARILHHGTLLFNSDVSKLSLSLKGNEANYADKAVKSKRAKVINLNELTQIDMDTFIRELQNVLKCKDFSLPQKAISEIENIREKKFATMEWNFGYSPNYTFRKTLNLAELSAVFMEVRKGKVHKINLSGDPKIARQIESSFLHQYHHWEIFKRISHQQKLYQLLGLEEEDFISLFF